MFRALLLMFSSPQNLDPNDVDMPIYQGDEYAKQPYLPDSLTESVCSKWKQETQNVPSLDSLLESKLMMETGIYLDIGPLMSTYPHYQATCLKKSKLEGDVRLCGARQLSYLFWICDIRKLSKRQYSIGSFAFCEIVGTVVNLLN